ncbi:ABC transporter ATP-binding protein [Vibrio cholerae]|uniref:ABC transporter ATP-binding protein n=1 Tax=Vibrio cholerae TaxID=666 RepID=UPI0002C165DC|nr:ABC transporter ATP-binding protein [Vibrio cholerae]EMQ71623.1 polysaccharide ABC transporter, ATP-binding protein wzt [Vibrio cholerae O1 str. NHCC-008D]MCX9465818.1 ABC transporter ATP-binding protein [Vibrio cholerae]
MSSNIAIKIENVSKCYHIYEKPRDRLKQFIFPRIQKILGVVQRKYFREYWAVKNISFEVKRGETVGIIGRNGSGKSTLLQMICGTLNQTTGEIHTNGRIAALLELGSGFNPEFTGRENVYLNGAILGLSREEIDERFQDILDFADIGGFIDQPVKTYSSGMMVRLAFAVQAQSSPDILIVDEALAVGDAKFQAKCFDRLKQLKESGTSILLVTHSSEQIVTHCSHAVLIDKGGVIEQGHPNTVINKYMDLLFGKEGVVNNEMSQLEGNKIDQLKKHVQVNCTEDVYATRTGYNPYEYRWGDGAAKILDFYLSADNVIYPSAISSGQKVSLTLAVKFIKTVVCPILGITIKTKEGVTVYGVNSESLNFNEFRQYGRAGDIAVLNAKFECKLSPGDYFVSVGIATKNGEEVVPHDRRYDSIHLQVKPDCTFFGLVDLGLELDVEGVNR